MTAPALAAILIALIGAFLVYAGARHQRLTGRPRRQLRWLGWALLAVVLAILLASIGVTAALFTWMTLAMLVWSTVPLAVALWDRRRKAAK